MPVDECIKRILELRRTEQTLMTSATAVHAVDKQLTLETVFTTPALHAHLFPSGVIVRDSQSFAVGEQFLSNVPLLLSDRLVAIYTSTCSDAAGDVTSLSFGTCVECDVTCDMLRYCIDYYGNACVPTMKSHVLKHLNDLEQQCTLPNVKAKTVTCHFYSLEAVTSDEMRREIFDFMQFRLNFGSYVNRKRTQTQHVVNENPQYSRQVLHKL